MALVQDFELYIEKNQTGLNNKSMWASWMEE